MTARAGYCAECHGALEMKKDPLSVPHSELVRQGRWLTCLGCHDYHGNHLMDSRTGVADALSAKQIQLYFQGGPSPYPSRLRQPANRTRGDRD